MYDIKKVRIGAIDKICRRKDAFERDYSVKRIGVFGSFARNEANEPSEIDIVVEMIDPGPTKDIRKQLLEAVACVEGCQGNQGHHEQPILRH